MTSTQGPLQPSLLLDPTGISQSLLSTDALTAELLIP